MHSITVRPTPAKDLKSGDVFRAANDCNLKIKDISRTDEVVEIEYYIGTRDYVVSFFTSPERIIDVIIDKDVLTVKHGLFTIRPTDGASLDTGNQIRLEGFLYDVIDNQVYTGRGNLWYELTVREGLTNKSRTIEYASGTIFDVVTNIRDEA